jgi:beta-galactosidase
LATLTGASLVTAAQPAGAGALTVARPATSAVAGPGRDQPFDAGWRFHRGDAAGAERPEFDDAAWRLLDLPHDWSIEDLPARPESTGEAALWADAPLHVGPFDTVLSEGKAATGWVVGGTGWYRKCFALPQAGEASRAEIRFDGVYMNADVWLNGQHLGTHPYGYTGFAYDLTPHLKREGENMLAVRVRNGGQNSRWYSGSGIYRHVWLTVTGDVRIPLWGVYVEMPEITVEAATVRVRTAIQNHAKAKQEVNVRVRLSDPGQAPAGQAEERLAVEAGAGGEAVHSFTVAAPRTWSPKTPRLYRAEVEVRVAGRITDRAATAFGIRRIEVDAERGLRINGETVKLQGGCMHHDNGALGAAATERAEARRVELMKANGFNAIRTSHNAPSPAFLDACDRLGVMVIDEAFDMWREQKNPRDYHLFFDEWWQRDLESMVLRDRNHPSVIFWSIGNEIPERGEPVGVELAGKLAAAVKRLDASRPVTAAICGFWEHSGHKWEESDPAFAPLDVGGYNYEWKHYEPDHQRHPRRVMMGTESFPLEAFENWQMVQKLPYVLGDFVWTGMDYLGESGIGNAVLNPTKKENARPYPWFNAYCGDIDIIGGKKPQSYFRDVVWGASPLEMAVQRPVPDGQIEELSLWGWSDELRSWTWPGSEGKALKVRVYSSGEEVHLLVNGKEIGRKAVSAATGLKAEFDVPYEPGELKAIALKNAGKLAELSFQTAGKPAKLRLHPDRPVIASRRNDLAFVTAEVLDHAGNLVPDAVVMVRFSLRGAAELAGVGSANPKEVASFCEPRRRTYHGRCLAIVRPTGVAGPITLRAEAEGLAPASVVIQVL